ncbi:MAG: TonB-dependent receptor [Cyclobacteriaceae bacterium]|nr:TonB-dependent receptor [Cyclobacteriaceae bacterium]
MRTIGIHLLTFIAITLAIPALAQPPEKWGEGEIEKVEIQITKEKQITLPQAIRNYEKIPPRPAEPIKPEIKYDFKNLSFNTPDYNPSIRPLRLQAEPISKIYGNYVSAAFGNYASAFIDAYATTKRDKDKFYGFKVSHLGFGRGPVDDNNSASSNSQLRVFGKAFGKQVTSGGYLDYERIGTYFYGYTPGTDINRSLIKQTYNIVGLGGELENTTTGTFNYKLKGAFSYLDDAYQASESEATVGLTGDYELSKTSKILFNTDYNLITRKDATIEARPRHLLRVKGAYQFYLTDNLLFSAGATIAYENDTLGKAKDVHLFPDFRASYPLSPSVELYAAFTGDIDKVSLHTLARENAWINANVGTYHTNRTAEFLGGLRGKLGSKVSYGAGLSFANLKNWYFYRNDDADRAKFNAAYDEGNAKRTNFFGELSFAYADRARVSIRGDYFGYNTGNVAEAWHRPKYRLGVTTAFNIYSKLLLNVDALAQGGAKAQVYEGITGIYSTTTLPAAFDLNAKLSYIFSRQVSVFVKGNNLLSNEYPIYLNYPVRGLNVMGGITWVF